MLGYVYILQSDNSKRYYVGSAIDPEKRLLRHNGNAVTATRGRGPWRIAALIRFADEATARRAEVYVKRQKRREVLEAIIRGTFDWPCDLNPTNLGESIPI